VRTARATGWGIGTAATALAVAWAIGGSGLQGGGISVVGANPATVPVVASGYTSPAGAPSSSAAKGDAAVLTDSGTGRGTGTGSGAGKGRSLGNGEGATATAAPATGSIGVSGSPVATGSATPTVTHGGRDGCAVGALRLQVTALTSAGTAGGSADSLGAANLRRYAPSVGTRTQQLTLTFTNVSRLTCTLRGYPSVDFLRGGVRGPLSAPDTFAASPSVVDVDLSPGATATAEITFIANGRNNPQGSRCEQVIAVRVYAPGSTRALSSTVRDTSGHRLPSFYVCGHRVVVQAVQRG
jgi:hypothetical protein